MTTMKKISRNVIVGLIFSAAGFVAVTAVPASAATAAASSTTTVQADSTQSSASVTLKAKSARVWEW
jgi:hypothetical protein